VLLGIAVPKGENDVNGNKVFTQDNKDFVESYYRFIFMLPILFCLIRAFFLLTVYKFDPPQLLIE